MSSKVVTMNCTENNQSTTVSILYDQNAAWPEIIDQFNQFLCSMGYIPRKYNQFVVEIDNVT